MIGSDVVLSERTVAHFRRLTKSTILQLWFYSWPRFGSVHYDELVYRLGDTCHRLREVELLGLCTSEGRPGKEQYERRSVDEHADFGFTGPQRSCPRRQFHEAIVDGRGVSGLEILVLYIMHRHGKKDDIDFLVPTPRALGQHLGSAR